MNQIGGHEEEDDGYDSDGDEKTKMVYTPEGPAALASALKQNSSLTALRCQLPPDPYLNCQQPLTLAFPFVWQPLMEQP